MRIVFCGTPKFAVATMEAVIAAGHEVMLVVTQPDRAVGRAGTVQAPAVKIAAQAHGIPVVQPEKIKNNVEFRERLEGLRTDVILVVAYGRMIPDWMLHLPRYGCVNLHGSLLPKYRGAAPIQWAIAQGETVTGVTTMLLEAGMDTGPMLLARAVSIAQEETAENLFESLAEIGAALMVETLAGLEAGMITTQAQNHALATLAPILTREDGRIDFNRRAEEIYNRWRGFQPWPGAFTEFRGKKFIVAVMRVETRTAEAVLEPGTLVVEGDVLQVVCGGGSMLEFVEVQVEGKKRMAAAEFLRGHQVTNGERVGS